MSRTYKDKKWTLRFPEYDYTKDREAVPYEAYRRRYDWETSNWIITDEVITRYYYLPKKGVKTKKRRKIDTNWHWMSTPSWWTRLMMNRPQRRAAHLWEKEAQKTEVESLEDLDIPNVSHKPHKYYW